MQCAHHGISVLLTLATYVCTACVVKPMKVNRVDALHLTSEMWQEYDGKKPLLIAGMLEDSQMRKWTPTYLAANAGNGSITSTWLRPRTTEMFPYGEVMWSRDVIMANM